MPTPMHPFVSMSEERRVLHTMRKRDTATLQAHLEKWLKLDPDHVLIPVLQMVLREREEKSND